MRPECPQAVTVVSVVTQRGCPSDSSSHFSCKLPHRRLYPYQLQIEINVAVCLCDVVGVERSSAVLPTAPRGRLTGTGGNRPDSIATQSNPRSLTLQSQRSSKSRWSNKNGESPINQPAQNRKDEFLNGHDPNARGANETATTISSDERTPAQDGPRFSPETGTTAPPNELSEQKSNITQNYQHNYQNPQRPGGTASDSTTPVAEDSGAPCEMRRTSPQNKVDRSGTGQSGSSPRVTLRLNQVRSARDDKKGGTGNSRQGLSSASSQGQMEAATKTSTSSTGASAASSAVSTSGNSASAMTSSAGAGAGGAAASGASGGANSTTSDSGDVYEFKSSKEATPVRGASSSPNPEKEKEKEKESSKSSAGSQSQGTGSTTTSGNAATTSSEAATTISSTATSGAGSEAHAAASPSSKRSYEGDEAEEQEDEVRRKKRKETEGSKETTKGPGSGRQNPGRNTAGTGDKCAKSGKQGSSGGVSAKSGQSASTTNADRKSPGVTSAASSSPKPPNSSSSAGGNSKTGITGPPESDGEDDRPKSSDSSSAPKVPPLKIVIPQSTTSEQEVGARNGKNTSNRSHQLPYVVPSSNSNDSTDKDQNLSASGTTSPTEVGNSSKTEDKKDFTGVLHNEERSTHHQRVLRSSHRGSNGGNGSTTSKESGGASSANGSYSNASPLPATSSTDRSNNSSPQQQQQQTQQQQSQPTQQSQPQPQQQQQQQPSPLQGQQQQQQRHNSPSPETTNADSSKSTAQESTTSSNSNTSSGNNSSTSTTKTGATEKSEKNTESNGKSQKDGNESTETSTSSASTTTTNTTSTPAPVELHPRKRKLKSSKEAQQAAATASANESSEAANAGPEVHPHDQPITNCYQLFLNIRKQIERRRKGLFPVQPKPPQGFKDYLMNRCTYVLAGNANKEPNINPPGALQGPMKDLYVDQEKERYRLRMQHVVEKEKLVLSVEQEILRVHGRAARALANQSLPFSVCTILKDEEVYNVITPEQEEKDRNARSRYNGRLFLSWLQDVDDKWEKIKEAMLLRHHNEAESLHAVQRMDWEWKLKEVGLCEFKATPQIEDLHVPMVHVSDDFDLLPA